MYFSSSYITLQLSIPSMIELVSIYIYIYSMSTNYVY